MPQIIPPSEMDENKEEAQQEQEFKITYEATEYDEEEFLLMYSMHLQPSEIKAWPDDKRQWVIARYMHQEQQKREYLNQMRLMQQMQGIDLTAK